MVDTTHLQLPLLAAAQAQKHVTVNEALLRLDALVQLAVKDRDLTAPPVSPSDGDRYIPASGATGTWDGWDLNIAWYVDGVWTKLVPRAGWLAWVEDEEALLVHDGSDWIDLRPAFRGCLAYAGSNMTGQDFSGGLTAIPMSDEAYDTGGFHENLITRSMPAGAVRTWLPRRGSPFRRGYGGARSRRRARSAVTISVPAVLWPSRRAGVPIIPAVLFWRCGGLAIPPRAGTT